MPINLNDPEIQPMKAWLQKVHDSIFSPKMGQPSYDQTPEGRAEYKVAMGRFWSRVQKSKSEK